MWHLFLATHSQKGSRVFGPGTIITSAISFPLPRVDYIGRQGSVARTDKDLQGLLIYFS